MAFNKIETLELFKRKNILLEEDLENLLNECIDLKCFSNELELMEASLGEEGNIEYNVEYETPGKGNYIEAIVHRVKNGISVNYTEPYMRRRDPDTMVIGDDFPTDKPRFAEKYGYPFENLRKETFNWLKSQKLGMFIFFAGYGKFGLYGMAIVPANAAFFAFGLSMLQKIKNIEEIPRDTRIESVIYVAPPFRHTHFNGRQVVVHNRKPEIHEMFSYNLYPGPSAKKGVYGVLLTKGEREGWLTTHCSTVQVVSPYDNITTFMHEGASGGGKSEMLQNIVREPNGQILVGENIVNGEKIFINIPLFCSFNPVTDDMALCHPSIQTNDGKLRIVDAENAWFIRVDNITEYGTDPYLEKVTIHPSKPLLFFNIESRPLSTALIWEHIEDEPGKKCPNPRVIVPRDVVPNVINKPVAIDVRNFGVRTAPCTADKPTYGIIGLFHILPPALAWLWRLVSPRGYKNPSIISQNPTTRIESEGVGSYWPFATGEMVTHANLLLEQIINFPRVKYTLTPNQYIGVWKVGFKPQLLMREYLTRRGSAKLRSDQYQPARCPLLGYELNYLTIEGSKIPTRLLKVYRQPEVGEKGYDEGAKMLYEFFRHELQNYLTPKLSKLGRQIIEVCLDNGTVEDYINLIPMDYQYTIVPINGEK